MQPAPPGLSNPDFPPRYETPQAPQQLKRPPHVTSSTPAKRITFFKSGDAQFGGVKMAIHRRSFKSFDALLDDLSRKVPLPFGVRTITTPHGTHSIRQLEQLQDGGYYLCSDRRQAKPINMKVAEKRPAIWHHSRPHSAWRKPSRPEEAPMPPWYHRHPKRIVLVKNTDQALRHSIILSHRSARSLRAFLDEVSELMHCHIRKLYTLDGHTIDSIQGLVQCPSVLVCVGREPFRPLLVESFRKNSDEKLPGLRMRSRSSIYSEGQESKKNVNFGLETKKSIIHPRSDSSNRSTRFSLSSEKSFPNELNMSPGISSCVGTCLHTKESRMNDDIEKRVIINKDGSLCVEMKVCFHLLNDETLQWSTEIKKSAGAVNECCVGKGEEPCYLPHGKSESLSEPESVSASEAEDPYATKIHQILEESHCQNCCNHCQEYDIWKNPTHWEPGVTRRIRSSSSSTSSRMFVCRKESVESVHTVSRSREECMEQVLEKATCIQQTVEDGDTPGENCAVYCCCSQSGVCTTTAKPRDGVAGQKNGESTDYKDARSDGAGSATSHKDQVSVKINQVVERVERPISVVSNCSKVLEALKEDQYDEDEDEDLPPSVSRASVWSRSENPEECKVVRRVMSNCSACTHKFILPMYHLSPRPPSKASCCSTCSVKTQKSSKAPSLALCGLLNKAGGGDSNYKWAESGASSRQSPRCQCRAASPHSPVSEAVGAERVEEEEGDSKRVLSSRVSKVFRMLHHSSCVRALSAGSDRAAPEEAQEKAISTTSTSSRHWQVCLVCNGSNRTATPASRASEASRQLDKKAELEATGLKTSGHPGKGEVKGRAIFTMSAKTGISAKFECNASEVGSAKENSKRQDAEEMEDNTEEGAASVVSAKIQASAQSRRSRSSKHSASERAVTPKEFKESKEAAEDNGEKLEEEPKEKRADGAMSAIRNVSAKSKRSEQSQGIVLERAPTPAFATSEHPCDEKAEATPEEAVKIVARGMSNFSKASARLKSSTTPSVKSDANCEDSQKAPSAMPAMTNASATSRKSNKSNTNAFQRAETPALVILEGPAPADMEAGAGDSLSWSARASRKSQKNAGSSSDTASTPETPTPKPHYNASRITKSSKSNKCNCSVSERGGTPASKHATPEVEGVTSDMSVRSVTSQHSDSKRVLTPTSTMSLSIGVVEDQAADDADESVSSATSKSLLSLAQSTESKSQSERATSNAPALQVAGENEDSSEQATTPFSASSSEAEVTSVNSAATKISRRSKSEHHLHVYNDRIPTAMSSSSVPCNNPTSKASRHASKATSTSVRHKNNNAAEHTWQSASEVKNREDVVSDQDEKASSACSRSPSQQSRDSVAVEEATFLVSSASSLSASHKSTIKDKAGTVVDNRQKSNLSNVLSYLQVKEEVTKLEAESNNGSVHSVKTNLSKKAQKNDFKVEGALWPNSAASQNFLSSSLPEEKLHNHKSPINLLGDSDDSTLSCSFSAAVTHLLKENTANTRPATGRLKSNFSDSAPEATDCCRHANNNKSEESSKSRHRKKCSSSQQHEIFLVPSSLPNTSPTQVVNEWLNKIPSDSSMYKVGDDFDEHCKEMENEEVPKEQEDSSNGVAEGKQPTEKEQEQHKEAEVENEANAGEPEEPELLDTADVPLSPDSKCLKKELVFPKGCHSSVQVMKILLSSKLDRSNSLPEVSPVYGRKLSSSAKGLLDCLAKLQLLGAGPIDVKPKTTKYQELMGILQTLWLSDPSDCEQMRQKDKLKDHGTVDDEYSPRSSSGVDVSSISGGSGKSLGTVDQKVEAVHGRVTPVIEQVLQEETELQEGEGSFKQPPEEVSDTATPGITSRVQGSSGHEDTDTDKERHDREKGLVSDKRNSSDESPENVIAPFSSNKSSGNDSNAIKSAEEMGMDPQHTSSGTPPSVQGVQLAKKASQDPNPIWVLNLLKKLEKQFMTHYVTAMSEFKVRWDLDESVMLDTMINELRDEVQKRIQSSISQELKKIQSRAGRGPRPPTQALARESTLQTEQRRRRLKVMQKKTISQSEDNFTATATDRSDQQSDDEYCPCDTCMKKKMAAQLVTPKFANPPPLIKDFDLRKILQKKQEPPVQEQTDQMAAAVKGNQGDNNYHGVMEEEEQDNEVEEQACIADTNNEEIEAKDKEGRNEDIGEQGEVEKEGKAEEGEAEDEGEAVEEGEAEEGDSEVGEEEVGEEEESEAEGGKAAEVEATEDGEAEEDEAVEGEAEEKGEAEEADAEEVGEEESEAVEGEAGDGEAGESEAEKEGEALKESVAVEEGEAEEEVEAEEGEALKESVAVKEGEAEEGEAVEKGEAEEVEAVEGEAEEDGEVEVGEEEEDEAEVGEAVEEGEAVEGEAVEEDEAVKGEAVEEGEAEEDEVVEKGEGEKVEAEQEGEAEEGEAVEESDEEEVEAVEGEAKEDCEVEVGEAKEGEAEVGEAEESEAAEVGEAAEEGNEAGGDIAPESEAEDIVNSDGETGGVTDAGEGKETAEEGDEEEEATEDEEPEDEGDGEGSTKSHKSKDEGGADIEEGEQETIDENEGAGNQAENKSGNTDTEKAENKSVVGETEDEYDVETNVENSEIGTHGEQRGEENQGKQQEEEQSEISSAEKTEENHRGEESPEHDENGRSGESEDAVEEFTVGESKEQETGGGNSGNTGEDEEVGNQLMRQATKSSIESWQGSLDDSMDFESMEGTDDTKSSHENFRARSNRMYPTSSEEEVKGT